MPTTTKTWPVRKGLILQWNEGWGEIAPLPGFSKETFEEAASEILTLLPNLSSRSATLPSVAFGIASALSPSPFTTPIRIPLCQLKNDSNPDLHPEFRTIKLKLGHLPVDEAIVLVQKHINIHSATSCRLRLDCNCRWTLDQALYFASHFSACDFEYLEEPLCSFSDLVRFSELTRFPIAVDESMQKYPYLEIPTLKAAVVKPTLIGSIPSLPKHISLILSSAYESSLGLLQIAKRAYLDGAAVGLDTFRFFPENLLIPPLKAESGFLTWSPTDVFPIDLSKLQCIK